MAKNTKNKTVEAPVKAPRVRNQVSLPDSDFAVQWERASSVDEFCKATGYTRVSAIARARYLRSKNADIKRMPRGRRSSVNVEQINQAISQVRSGRA